jgi:hypothetical protein
LSIELFLLLPEEDLLSLAPSLPNTLLRIRQTALVLRKIKANKPRHGRRRASNDSQTFALLIVQEVEEERWQDPEEET